MSRAGSAPHAVRVLEDRRRRRPADARRGWELHSRWSGLSLVLEPDVSRLNPLRVLGHVGVTGAAAGVRSFDALCR